MSSMRKKSSPSAMTVSREIGAYRRDRLPTLQKPRMWRLCDYNETVLPVPGTVKLRHHLHQKNRSLSKELPNPYATVHRERIFYTEKPKKRVKLPEIPNEKIKTIIDDIHPEFFSVVHGRAVRPNDDFNDYVMNINKIMHYRTDTAYLNDMRLQIQTLLEQDEMDAYKSLYNQYRTNMQNFQKCIEYGYMRAMAAVEKSLKVEEKVELMKQELADHSYTFNWLKNEILHLFDRFATLERYRDFLDDVSPLLWQLGHKVDELDKSKTFKNLFIDDVDDEVYYKTMTWFRGIKVGLYFKKPSEVINELHNLAHQCMNYLRINEARALKILDLKKLKELLNTELEREIEEKEYIIGRIQKNVTNYEETEVELKENFFRLLKHQFKDIVLSKDALKLNTSLQFICEKTLNIVSFFDTSSNLMRHIEHAYTKSMYDLDCLDHEVVKKTTKEYFAIEAKKWKNAHISRRLLNEWECFRKSLTAAFERPDYPAIVKKRIEYRATFNKKDKTKSNPSKTELSSTSDIILSS